MMQECSNHIQHEGKARGLYVVTHECILLQTALFVGESVKSGLDYWNGLYTHLFRLPKLDALVIHKGDCYGFLRYSYVYYTIQRVQPIHLRNHRTADLYYDATTQTLGSVSGPQTMYFSMQLG